ncbi:MAG: hypothetical protein OEW39_07225 [Deltaproteobacteria bacterium]|nr:hypothetical protein [Deltaproteobacteria bacterium]
MSRVERTWTRRIPGYAWAKHRTPGAEDESAMDAPEGEDPAESTDELELQVPPEVEEARKESQEKRTRGIFNPALAPRAFSLQGRYLRALATRFARMISKVAEDSADLPQPGDEEWDVTELSRRRLTGRHIHQCRMVRERRKVALVLDTSPSCAHQARLFSAIARIAEELGDCEIFDAPNFSLNARKGGAEWEILPEAVRAWHFKGRVVIAFGDFDGIESICAASRVHGNKLYWFSCEERPEVLEAHRDTFVREYRGHYFPATSLSQLMKAMKRVR